MAAQSKTLHVSAERLALYSTGDLPLFPRLIAGYHLRSCARCRDEVQAFRTCLHRLQSSAAVQTALPENTLEWKRLEDEILGNVAVGLAAARCIEKVGAGRRFAFTGGIVVTGLFILFVAGWLTHIPVADTERLWASVRKAASRTHPSEQAPIVYSETGAIAIRNQGMKVALQTSPAARTWASGPSRITSMFVEEETGQVVVSTMQTDEGHQ